MGNLRSKPHGCACGGQGEQVARRTVGLLTRHFEVDVRHSNGEVHTNVRVFPEPLVLKDGSRWVPGKGLTFPGREV